MPRNDGIDRTLARNRDLSGAAVGNAQAHNEREKEIYSNPDIVLEQTFRNVHFKQPTGSYAEMFDQLKKDGVISTRGLKEDAVTYCELLFDVNSAYFYNHGGYEYAKQFYAEAYKAAVEIVGGEQYILSAVMHADERNRAMSEALGEDVFHYHMHVVYIPVVEKQILWSKRCKNKSLVGTVKETIMQVSRSKKWESKPALDENGKPLLTKSGKKVLTPSYSKLQDDFYEHMRAAGYTDVERGQRGSTEEHLTVTQFKVEQEQKRLNDLVTATEKAEHQAQVAQERLDDIAPKLENIEKLTAEYIGDPEQILPAAGAVESGKAYREKKAKPFFKKLLDLLRSVYNAYLDMKSRLDRMQSEYRRVVRSNNAMSERIYNLSEEREGMLAELKDFDRVKQAYGPEQIAATIQSVKSQEQARKGQKHSHSRTAR